MRFVLRFSRSEHDRFFTHPTTTMTPVAASTYPAHHCLPLVLIFVFLFTLPADAQSLAPRFGLGFNTLLSTEDGLGFGFRGRASIPVNADLSFAADMGFTGFILEGRDDATYVIDPEVSAIVTLPGERSAPYILGGIGGYIPTNQANRTISGPTLHFGLGWVKALNDTTLFYEIDPALVIGKENVQFILPIRIGIIF